MSASSDDDEAQALREARQQVRALKAFYLHASIYVVVIVMLVLINVATGDAAHGNWWVQWPAIAWGAVVVIHGIFAMRSPAFLGPDWEERKVREIMRQRRDGQ